MKLELLMLAITAFCIFNIYYDGKYTKLLMSWKKYYQMGFFAVAGVSLYLLIKRNPQKCQKILLNANNVIKYMPIDKSSMDMISPILDFTSNRNNDTNEYNDTNNSFMSTLNRGLGLDSTAEFGPRLSEKRILQSGGGNNNRASSGATKRSVSETKKKYVASQQQWKCGDCNQTLNAWFEVDHKRRLEYGGTNEVTNLVALCRDCHGKKTAMENM